MLKGVVVLENGYDEKAQEAWVMVGVSQKTIAAAEAARKMISGSPAGGATSPMTPPDKSKGDEGSAPNDRIPSEIRRGNRDF